MAQLAALMFVNFRCKRGDNAMERISLLTTEPQLTDFKNFNKNETRTTLQSKY